jgi:hypothetical protein
VFVAHAARVLHAHRKKEHGEIADRYPFSLGDTVERHANGHP